MRYFEVEGSSPAEILEEFLGQQKFPREYVEMEVLEAGSKGFLGIGKKPAKVKLVFNDNEYLKRKARIYLSDILEKAGFDHHIEVIEQKGKYIFNIHSTQSEMLVGKSAIVLDSLQYLADRLARAVDSDVDLLVDVDSYRERVIAPLVEKAIRLAKDVKKTGKPAKMPPMSTVVRREVHIAAKSIPGIVTSSNGEGQIKSLTIFLDKGAKDNRDNREDRGNSPERGNRENPRRNNNKRRNNNEKEGATATDGGRSRQDRDATQGDKDGENSNRNNRRRRRPSGNRPKRDNIEPNKPGDSGDDN